MSKASEEIIKRSHAIREISDNPMGIIQGIIPVVMSYMQTGQLTRSGGIDAAARILAIVDMVDEKEHADKPKPTMMAMPPVKEPSSHPTLIPPKVNNGGKTVVLKP